MTPPQVLPLVDAEAYQHWQKHIIYEKKRKARSSADAADLDQGASGDNGTEPTSGVDDEEATADDVHSQITARQRELIDTVAQGPAALTRYLMRMPPHNRRPRVASSSAGTAEPLDGCSNAASAAIRRGEDRREPAERLARGSGNPGLLDCLPCNLDRTGILRPTWSQASWKARAPRTLRPARGTSCDAQEDSNESEAKSACS